MKSTESGKNFFVRRSDGMSVTNSKLERLMAKDKLPAFDFERHATVTHKD